MKEKLSALLDGELDENDQESLFQEISADPELCSTWERYHTARAVIRNELEGLVLPGLANRILQKIDKEPVILVPRKNKITAQKITRLVGSLAIAASVAAVSIVSLRPKEVNENPSAQQIAIDSSAVKNDPVRVGATQWDKRQPDLESTLNMYLVEHNEFSPATNFRGMMSYGRVVGYDNEK
ncbi:MAG: sigma-E factor negative regulatory protein [Gammaproteobacteria bacterium]|nr:sigma-E factor negative regulatory protein [Gammaproteobacteria bacterium]